MTLNEITLFDIILSLLYGLLIVLIAKWIQSRHKNNRLYDFLVPFIIFKIACAILFVVIHTYFYKGGDTFLFFAGGKFIASYFIDNPFEVFRIFRLDMMDFQSFIYRDDYGIILSFRDSTTLFVSQITSLFCMLTFNSFMAATILFSVAFSAGIWLLYTSVCSFYPNLYKIFALCFLFIPTVGIWGSGILKDPVTFSAMGIIFYSVIQLLTKRRILLSLALLFLAIFFCVELKPYILYAFIPAIFLWIYFVVAKGIKSPIFKIIFIPILLFSMGLGTYLFILGISSEAGKYEITNLDVVLEGFQSWHTYLAETRSQSGYSLENFELSPVGIIKKIPEALVVTYFRPFPTEITNLGTLLGGIESFILLLITVYVIIKTGFLSILKIIYKSPELKFFLFFALALGVAVGLTSYNFGALSRYKIPCMPFFTASLAMIYYFKKEGILRKPIKST